MINPWSETSSQLLGAGESAEICAVPGGIHCVTQDEFSPNIRVSCATPGCNYGGPIHRTCLQQWTSTCQMRCRMLSSNPCFSPGSELPAAICESLESLFNAYRCPVCGQCALCRTCLNNQGVTVMVPDDPFASVSRVVQHVTNLSGTSCRTNSGDHSQSISSNVSSHGVSDTRQPILTGTADHGDTFQSEQTTVPVNSETAQAFKMTRTRLSRSSLQNSAWPNHHSSVTSPASWNQQVQLMRRLSLRGKGNMSNIPSENTSGLGSSLDSGSRSSQVASDMDGGYWSASPGITFPPDSLFRQPRYSNTMGSKMVSSGESYFTFDPMPPLQSNSPVPGSIDVPEKSGEIRLENESQSLPTGQQLKYSYNNIVTMDQRATTNADTLKSAESTSSLNRRHNSMSQNSGRNSSFWPTDPYGTRSPANGTPDRRKVVNRKGNIFQPRPDFKVFENLPAYKQNAYFIQMDDDSCTGNEDTRAFLLAQLTSHHVSEVYCLACHKSLTVYDHFPVIDGVFFLSPICHRSNKRTYGLRVTWHSNGVAPVLYSSDVAGANADRPDPISNQGQLSQCLLESSKPVVPPPGCLGPRQQLSVGHFSDNSTHSSKHHGMHSARQDRYLHALCMTCISDTVSSTTSDKTVVTGSTTSGSKILCRTCDRNWSGSTLLIGGLYTYDVFAALPCCPQHLTCNACGQRLDGQFNSGSSTAESSVGNGKSNNSLSTQASGELLNGQNVQQASDIQVSPPMNKFPLPFFSQYSQLISCPFCARVDYHFVKPFDKFYHTLVSA